MNKSILGIFILAILTIGTFPLYNGDVTPADATSNRSQTATTLQTQTPTALNEPQVQQQAETQQQQESGQSAQGDRQLAITNHPPRANAGSDEKVNEGASIILDARRSSDPDAGDKVSYLWRQISGPAVVLENASASVMSFAAPEVNKHRSVSFVLFVRDEKGAQGTDTVKVSIRNVESNPDTTSNNKIGTVQNSDNTNSNSNLNTNNNRNPTSTTTSNPPGLENTTDKALTNAQNAFRNNGSRVITPSSAETQMSRSAAFTPFAISTAVSAVQADNIVNTRTAYDIIFKTASAGAIKTVEMTFPQGTNIGSATMLEVSGIGQGGTSAGGPNGQTLTYTVANPVNVPSGVFLRFEVWKILNPPTPAANLAVQVTTKDSGGGTIDSGTSASYSIKQITTSDIADNAILSAKIGDGQVGTADIAGNSITSSKLLDNSVTTTCVNNVCTSKLADNSVITSKIANNQITTSKIQTGAVTPQMITRGGIVTVPAGQDLTMVASCIVGEVVTGGGFDVTDTNSPLVNVDESDGTSAPVANPERWTVHATNSDQVDHSIFVSAQCLKILP